MVKAHYINITFIDDLSHKVWIYSIKQECKALNKFKEFKLAMENELDLPIKILRSHNGNKFTSREFNQFCKYHGIKRQLTFPYTPRQNGVTERMNKTLANKAKAMMHAKSLPLSYWV